MTKIYLTPRTEFLETKTVADAAIPVAQKGAISGVAPLDADAKVSINYLPPTVKIYRPNELYPIGTLVHVGTADIYRANSEIAAFDATPIIPEGTGVNQFTKISGSSGGNTDDAWISDIAGSNILLDATGEAITTVSNEVIHFGDGNGPEERIKGINLAANSSSKTFHDYVFLSGSPTGLIDASKLPFVFDTEGQARIAAGWMVKELVMFLKNLENDLHFDQLVGMYIGQGVDGLVHGGIPTPLSSLDMDNNTFTYDDSVANSSLTSTGQTEWFEVVVGRNRAGDKYWSFWFYMFNCWNMNTAATNQSKNTYNSRFHWQQTANDDFATKPKIRYYSNGTVSALAADERDFSSSNNQALLLLPQLTQRNSFTKVQSGANLNYPIWIEPITLELMR